MEQIAGQSPDQRRLQLWESHESAAPAVLEPGVMRRWRNRPADLKAGPFRVGPVISTCVSLGQSLDRSDCGLRPACSVETDQRCRAERHVLAGISARTVETHLSDLFERLGIGSRTELATRAPREGWLEVPA